MFYEDVLYRTQFDYGERFLPERVLVVFGCVFYVFLAVFCIALLTGVSVLGLAAVFLAKNTRLPRQKSSQGVQPCCVFFLAFGHFLLKKPLRKPSTSTPFLHSAGDFQGRCAGCRRFY
ncbi:hypothetical protein [Neisseria bacilliformis]|uniref:hypothetical protein n=1 Tax=Neisseria bacilliformis TaxID=267212 RepID=UPI000B3298A8|nr:hypothetical protein [Neisseria bacilliformis]